MTNVLNSAPDYLISILFSFFWSFDLFFSLGHVCLLVLAASLFVMYCMY